MKVLLNRRALNYKQIANELNISDKVERKLLSSLLADLSNKNIIDEVEIGKYRGKSKTKQLVGILL